MKTRFLPEVPKRLSLIYDDGNWRKIELSFAGKKETEADIYFGAFLLLLDIWLYLFGHHDSREGSPLNKLAELTRSIEKPPIKIAHCLRDLAYGNEARTDDLIAMLKSDDPAYRKLFEQCLWLETEEEREKSIKRKKK